MRVMFDISALGVGHAIPLYRSGVFRVVQHIAAGLAVSDEVDLKLSAGLVGSTIRERFRNLDASLAYRESDVILKTVPLPHEHLKRLVARLVSDSGERQSDLLYRVVGAAGAQKTLERYLDPLTENALRRSDIFHSPYFALPERTGFIKGLKRFLMVHDLLPVRYPHYFYAGEESSFKAILGSLRPDDWVLCNSENTRNDLCEYFPWLERSRTFVTLLAADAELFYRCQDDQQIATARQRYKIPEGPYVLSLCTIEPRKNLDHLIQCFSDLVRQQKIDDLNLVLVGAAGWKNQKVFDQIIRSGDGVRNRIVLTGYISNEDLAAIYSGALMFVYASLYEGFGLPPLEAMQCGVPVITSNNSSLPEVVGNAGILVDPRDKDQLCSSMLHLYQSPSQRAALSESALTQSRQFSWGRCLRETIDAYKTALSN